MEKEKRRRVSLEKGEKKQQKRTYWRRADSAVNEDDLRRAAMVGLNTATGGRLFLRTRKKEGGTSESQR